MLLGAALDPARDDVRALPPRRLDVADGEGARRLQQLPPRRRLARVEHRRLARRSPAVISRRARRAAAALRASTTATGWPTWCTSPAASSGSSGRMAPIWFSPGMSAAVSTRATPSQRSAAATSSRVIVPRATGEPSTAA